MKLESLTQSLGAKARYLAIVLPVFALLSTIHAGCSSGARGYYNYGYGRKVVTPVPPDPKQPPPDCTPAVSRDYRGYVTYYGCDDDDDGYYYGP